ncbi:MAG: HAD family phosphatase [Oscillospiraceae bacterium]|nr:HAD family phosphatase [Oscillospiraceae bacterium]
MILNIIFDMGGVLLDFSEDRVIRSFFSDFSPEEQNLLRAAIFGTGIWREMDRGVYHEAQTSYAICQNLPQHLHAAVTNMIPRYWECLAPIPAMNRLAREWKAVGRRLYLLTNAPHAFHREQGRIPALPCFDGIFASCDYLLSKPDPAIYRKFLETFSLRTADCFFIDDTPANIDGARSVGIAGHCFADRDVAALRQAMEAAD